MIIQIFVWWSPKGRCYGNQLNMGDVRKCRVERPLLFALAFDNGLSDRKSAFKRTIFAAISPQFDDDVHSSRWRLEPNWKIAILISAQ